jgi:GNAT superfamily N-acetyltransferase
MDDEEPGLRPAAGADAAAIARVQCAAALVGFSHIFPSHAPKPTPNALGPEWRELLADPATDVVVATGGGDLITGVVALRRTSLAPTGFLLARLYVDPAHWGAGIGARLHDRVVARARRLGATGLDLWVLEANVRARALYERRGWVLVPGRTQVLPVGPVEVGYRLHLGVGGQSKSKMECLS